MSRFKKLVLSLSLIITMSLALVVGLMGFKGGKESVAPPTAPSTNNGGGSYVGNTTINQPTTYYFNEGDVVVQDGANQIDYTYNPDDVSSAGKSVAYEYIFTNPMEQKLAVKLQTELEIEGVTVSYQYSTSKIENITESTSQKSTQPINVNGKTYMYIILTPEDAEQEVSYRGTVTFNMGVAGEINIVTKKDVAPQTYTYLKGEQVTKEDIGTPVLGEGLAFAGWYSDENYQTQAKFDTLTPIGTLYAKIGASLPDDWFQYISSNGGYYQVIKGKTPLTELGSTDIIIPERYKKGNDPEADVTTIYSGYSSSTGVFGNQTTITSISLPSTLTTIGNYAFYNCSSLTSVNIPESVTSIEDYAFQSCTGLTSITIPSSVTSIGGYAFQRCSSLAGVYITDIASWCGIDFGAISANPLNSGAALYLNGNRVTNLVISEGTTEIKSYAFYNCSSLTSVEFGENSALTSIGNLAFNACTSLTSIDIPSSVTSIGYTAFDGCSSLTSIAIPDGVTSIGANTFNGCSSLTSVEFGKNSQLTSIGGSAFQDCRSLTSITIPASVTNIGNQAFSWCYDLVEVYDLSTELTIAKGATDNGYVAYYAKVVHTDATIPSKITTDKGVAYYMESETSYIAVGLMDKTKTSVVLDSRTTSINQYAFRGCRSLTSITIPESVTRIGTEAFQYCYALAEVYDLSPSLTITKGKITNGYVAYYAKVVHTDAATPSKIIIDKGVAYYMESDTSYIALTLADKTKTSVVLDARTTSINQGAFGSCDNLTSINIPSSVTSIGGSAFSGCKGLTSVYITDIASWCAISFGDASANPLNSGAALYLNGNLVTDLVIPEGVTTIGNHAFYGCSSLTSINIPSSVTSIGNNAFYDCTSLTSVEFGDNSALTSIGEMAFRGCSSLTSINIPSSVTSIGGSAFQDCSSLTSVEFGENSALTSIGGSAFRDCSSLTSITIPDSVTRIGSSAFYNCSNLANIIFEDTGIWYKTSSSGYTGGEIVDVTDSAQNATWFKSTSGYYNYYWYKLDNSIVLNANGGTFEGVTEAEAYPVKVVQGLENVEGSNNYGFALNANGYYESQNKGVKSSYSLAKITFSANAGDTVEFTVINSAENNWDYGIFSKLNTTLTASYSADSSTYVHKSFKGLSSTAEQTVSYTIDTAGTYFIYVKYIKDSGGNSGNDSLQIKSSVLTLVYDYSATFEMMFEDGTIPATPVREGYTFVGWFTEAEGGTQVTEITNMVGTLYAHWEEN